MGNSEIQQENTTWLTKQDQIINGASGDLHQTLKDFYFNPWFNSYSGDQVKGVKQCN